MGDNVIYFNASFKSYDITRQISRAETWYEWVERGRNMMARASFSEKTMEWIAKTLKEASKTQGLSVRRWKFQDQLSDFFCSRNYNKSGRYISIVNMKGKRNAVIIIPEWSLNSGWLDIASKIMNFINAKPRKLATVTHRTTEEGLLYSDTVRNNKWTTREMNDAKVERKGRVLEISGDTGTMHNELLAKSIVGSLPEDIPNINLSEIRRWSSSNWKHLHGFNIYEMGRNQFLFEIPNKRDADHIVKGNWFWKNHKFQLNWWSPTSNAVTENLKHVWIRLVGLPLQFWSQNIFKEIGEFCGGWIQTEEETELRNHLKWARLKVRGDEETVPKVVNLVHDGKTFKIQVWIEAPTRIMTENPSENQVLAQQGIDNPYRDGLGYTEVTGHVGTSTSILHEGEVEAEARGKAYLLNESKRKSLGWRKLGSDPLAQLEERSIKHFDSKAQEDPLYDEVYANQVALRTKLQQNRGDYVVNTLTEVAQPAEEVKERDTQSMEPVEEDAMSIIHFDGNGVLIEHTEARNEVGVVNVEEAIPLNSIDLPESIETTPNSPVPLWFDKI